MSDYFVQRTHRFILQHQMIRPGETVLVGVSGGVDSLTLLYVLHALHHQLNCHLHVAHLDHSFRADSAVDADFVSVHARHLGLPISCARIDVPQLMQQQKLSAEAAARRSRYQFYECVSDRIGATKIALGHHRGDGAETILINLLRGAGMSGLKGILPMREGKFIRPLLDFSRQEIEEFAAQLGLQPRHDSTNRQLNHLRNRIRLELIPFLEQSYNSNLQNVLNQTAGLLRTESDYLDVLASEAFQACQVESRLPDTVVLDRDMFRQYHLALRRRILRIAIGEVSREVRDFYFNHFESILKLIDGQSPNVSLRLPSGWEVRRAYNQIIFQRVTNVEFEFDYEIAVPGYTDLPVLNAEMTTTVEKWPMSHTEEDKLPDGKFQAVFDLDRLQLPLKLRNRRDGDRFQPFGMRGSKKLKDLLIDAKVPRHERDRVPILVSGNQILWVVGHRTGESFKIRAETKHCLHFTYLPHTTDY